MANKYRLKDKSGKEIVTKIYGGRSSAGRDTLSPDILKGLTPEQHCQAMIKKDGGGYFKRARDEEDQCWLPSWNYQGEEFIAPVYSYMYQVCQDLEITGTLNGKATAAKELSALKGGERVVITANQTVTWTISNASKLEKVAMNETTYSFTMPKSGTFTIKATGKCDPSKSKNYTVGVKAVEPVKPPMTDLQFPKDKFVEELYKAMKEFGITEKNDIAGFLGNVEHETMGFSSLTEGEGLKYRFSVWKTINDNTKNWVAQKGSSAESEFNKLSEKQKINIMYHAMNGNNKPNDGWDFRGRGAIQLTGRGNYQGFADYIKRPDIMNNPNLIATDVSLAARASAWFWKKGSKASSYALQGSWEKSRSTVNKGRGMEDTLRRINNYLNNNGLIPLP
ncbi:glycoside hydrolase family 19 protein [Neisseriaceae bacterium B1]